MPPDYVVDPALPEPVLKKLSTAQSRFSTYEKSDPFRGISASLLSSANITDYARTTGMVFPYFDHPRFLKSASYAARIGDRVAYWNANGKKVDIDVEFGKRFLIPSNSIVFVTTEELFQLPNYIAVRFNLKIDLVHKGLLLGTGPIVDPGFVGKLWIPLHNLTTNEYYLSRGERFIWVEFTKLSGRPEWSTGSQQTQSGVFREFPANKRNLTPEDYLRDANATEVRSSIPMAMHDAKSSAESAKKDAKTAARNAQFAAVAVFLSIGILILTVVNTINGNNTRIDDLQDRLKVLELTAPVDGGN